MESRQGSRKVWVTSARQREFTQRHRLPLWGRAQDIGVTTACVVICTYDRSAKLAAALERLAAQVVAAPDRLEVLVVDNRSTDETAAVARHWVEAVPDRFRYVHEPCPGKSNALNRALRETMAPLLFMLDDDCLPEPGWAQAMLDTFTADATLEVVGGRVELHDPADWPVTLRTWAATWGSGANSSTVWACSIRDLAPVPCRVLPPKTLTFSTARSAPGPACSTRPSPAFGTTMDGGQPQPSLVCMRATLQDVVRST